MKQGKSGKTLIVNSLLWAAAILATSLALAGTGKGEELIFLFMALWFASFLSLSEENRSLKEEWACIRSLFSKTKETDYL